MIAGSFSDTGYRLRKNKFYRDDEWYPFGPNKIESFYDTTFFNSDTFLVDENDTTIAEMYFRIETNEIAHSRVVK